MRMGIVADDLTGSHDIGVMFAKAGYLTDVYTYAPSDTIPDSGGSDICILNTGSRLDSPQVSYSKVRGATLALKEAGARQYFAKTSSAFVGPVGTQFDAVLDALGQDFAIVVVAFPKNGRVTVDGVHFVHGKKLEDSEFRNDPAHPMTRSSLVEILQSQTRRRVGLVDHSVIARGPGALCDALEKLRATCNYVVLDVISQTALRTIAQAVADAPVLCGSSALAEELPALWGDPGSGGAVLDLPEPNGMGVLCAAGSLMPQTIAQIRHMRNKGAAPFELNTLALFDSRTRQAEVDRLAGALELRLRHGQHVVVHTPNSASKVEKTRMLGAQRGLTRTEVARLVSETLAQVVATTRARCGLTRLVIAGGESSAAVCTRLGVKAMRVLYEIQPGVPSCLALGNTPLLLVLKSGSFGSPDFIEQAINHLQSLPDRRGERVPITAGSKNQEKINQGDSR